MPDDPKNMDDREDRAGTTPYGPHRGQIDESAGGADSSPMENDPAEQRPQVSRERRDQGPGGQDPDPPQP